MPTAADPPKPLKVFVRDVRKNLKAPSLPFVVGQMGVDRANPGANRRSRTRRRR